MNYLIQRAHPRRTGPHRNSPLALEWRRVGIIPAKSATEAIQKAQLATGAPPQFIRITGIQTQTQTQ